MTYEHRSGDFFVLRTPLLPFDTLLAWAEAGPDEDALLAWVRELAKRPEIAEAVTLASEDLAGALNEPSKRVLLALARYVVRMSSRATPFGLFAGCSTGDIGDATALELPPLAEYQRRTDPGIELLLRVADALDEETKRRAPLVPTSTRYELAGQLRYVEERGFEHPLRAARTGRELRTALALAAQRLPANELAEALARELGAPVDAAERYVGQLVANQILIPDLRPRPTADDPTRDFAARLRNAGAPQADGVEAMAEELGRIDAAPIGTANYAAIRKRLEAMSPDAGIDKSLLVVLRKPAPALSLDRRVVDDMLAAAEVLRRLFAPPDSDPLAEFRRKFQERYEQRFVPLLEALDEELGIGTPGFGSPAADDLPLLKDVPLRGDAEPVVLAPLHKALLERVTTMLRDGNRELVVTDADVEKLAVRDPLPLPDSFAGVATLGGDGTVVLHAFTGPSGAQMVARFCHGDERMSRSVQEWLREEERLDRDAIFAEVVALPDRRDANVVMRPAFSQHEIPFLAPSSRPPADQLEAADLLLGVRNGRLCLWSQSRNREVIARVTNAHNFRGRGVSAYSFLGAMQRQKVAGALAWEWGVLSDLPELPRVRYGRVVLAKARWRVTPSEVKELRGELARKRGMPRFVTLRSGDNELLIDWENPVTIDAFLGIARGESVVVQEVLPLPETMPVHGPEGRFVNEIVVPFVRREARPRKQSGQWSVVGGQYATAGGPPATDYRPPHQRIFPPGGGEWLFWKLYTGYSTADRLLVESIGPALQRLQQEGRLTSWFFIRYGDPDHHLRLRVRGGDSGDLLNELGRLFASLVEQRWLARVQLDTYAREMERYGGPDQIDRMEGLFAADTTAVLAALPYLQTDATLRWQAAAWGTDRLIDDLGIRGEAKVGLLEDLCRQFGRDYDDGKTTRDALARKTRAMRAQLDAVFDDAALRPWQPAFEERSRTIAALDLRLDREPPFDDGIAGSVLHMHLNRVFRSRKREQERVLYDLMLRRERSIAAKASANGVAAAALSRRHVRA